MEISKRMWIAMAILGAGARLVPHLWNFTPMIDAVYTVARFESYAVFNRLFQPLRQAA